MSDSSTPPKHPVRSPSPTETSTVAEENKHRSPQQQQQQQSPTRNNSNPTAGPSTLQDSTGEQKPLDSFSEEQNPLQGFTEQASDSRIWPTQYGALSKDSENEPPQPTVSEIEDLPVRMPRSSKYLKQAMRNRILERMRWEGDGEDEDEDEF